MTAENVNQMELENSEDLESKSSYFRTNLVWKNILGFAILHLGMLYGIYLVLTLQVPIATLIWTLVIGYISVEGVTMGSHRMWSHRAYKGTPALKTLLLIGQTMAGQNCIWIWSRDHRQHHKFSDTDADPHNSKRGFLFCHIGWLMMRKLPIVITKGKTIDMSDLDADPFVMFQKVYYKPLYFLFAFFLPIYIPVLLWGDSWRNTLFVAYFARYMISLHGTWCVNSIAHLYGTRPYSKDIAPVESNFVAAISSGEGWHNYHHTFPWDFRAGEFGKHFNITATYIQLLADYGFAYDLRSATPDMVLHRIKKKGDGTHPKSSTLKTNTVSSVDVDVTDIFGEKLGNNVNITNVRSSLG
ncbi:hypothetical protein O3M35_009192 [Rhynocoris fuscipes]|uniref:Fatty acid desaturase domain-containing protein n=1 Tax=Rhynocoris fuscipes TaxID=488301 RepID=A0AAW1D3A0_9HEMI